MKLDRYVVFGTVAFITALLSISYFTEPPKKPAPKAPCVAADILRERMTKTNALRNLRPVHSAKLEDAISLYNSFPPPSDVRWDAAYLIDGPDGSGALIVGINGNACGIIIFSAEHYTALLNALEPSS